MLSDALRLAQPLATCPSTSGTRLADLGSDVEPCLLASALPANASALLLGGWASEASVPVAGDSASELGNRRVPLGQLLSDEPPREYAYAFANLIACERDGAALDGVSPRHVASVLLRSLPLPPACGVSLDELRISRFYLGGEGTGSLLHYHSAAVNLLAAGRKLWLVAPPTPANLALLDRFFPAGYAATAAQHGTSAAWLARNLPLLQERVERLRLFVQEEGQAVLVPHFWHHAVVNLAFNYGVTYSWPIGAALLACRAERCWPKSGVPKRLWAAANQSASRKCERAAQRQRRSHGSGPVTAAFVRERTVWQRALVLALLGALVVQGARHTQ